LFGWGEGSFLSVEKRGLTFELGRGGGVWLVG